MSQNMNYSVTFFLDRINRDYSQIPVVEGWVLNVQTELNGPK